MLYGGEPPAYNRAFIMKRLAYRIQELAYGGLPDHARARMREVLQANGFDENACAIGGRRANGKRDHDAPIAGTRLARDWKGTRYEVIVVHGGFEFKGRRYRSLTAVATAITGTHWNGRQFFGLHKTGSGKGAKRA